MLRVVLADDEVHIRNLLKYLIHWEEHGLQLIADYETGRDVAEHVREDRPDLIISDIPDLTDGELLLGRRMLFLCA